MSAAKRLRLDKPNYVIVISELTYKEINDYKNKLVRNELKPGFHLGKVLQKLSEKGSSLNELTSEKLIGSLLATKKPKFFPTKETKCDGSDWTKIEFKILGDINIAMPVQIFDNGIWSVNDSKFKEHSHPFAGELLFSPGPLLRKCKKLVGDTPEFLEVVINNKIDQNKYNELIERRLSPLFTYANESAKQDNCYAIVTIPGLGCGVFAGKFKGTLGERLNEALQYIIKQNAKNYSSIACIYYDPYNECKIESKDFDGVKYRVRPFSSSRNSQLCSPKDYEESGDEFSNCKLYKVVAWDHLSYPSNNFFTGRRHTDDGMAAAATNSMEVITGVKGSYIKGRYLPPKGVKNWEQVVNSNNILLEANGNVKVVNSDGAYLTLSEYELSVEKE